MHIGFDAKRFFHNATGLGNYARGTILGLAEHFPRHRYTLYAAQARGPFCTFPPGLGLRVQEACPLGRRFPSLWRSLGIPRAARGNGLDIFHGLSHELPLTHFDPRTRTVVTMHDLLFVTHPHLYPRLDRFLYAWKYRASCRRADLVVAVSQKTADDLQEIFGLDRSRIRVAYQSCDPAFSVAVDQGGRKAMRERLGLSREYILFVGSLVERKGVRTLIQALALLPRDRPQLVIAGAGPLYGELRAEARRQGVESSVRFLGRVPGGDLPGLYQMARIFAYPSLAEGFGIPIIEALTSGVPVVTSTGSCFAEPGGDAALYTEPGDAPALSQALTRVLEDESLRRDMIAKGQRHARTFHIARTSRALMDIYAELCPDRA
jgi:glycosyltransferase involved in cell wall biosynthesis